MDVSAVLLYDYNCILIFLNILPEPPVPSLQLLSAWPDVFPSEKVEFSCNITDSSDWTFTWDRDGQPVQDADPNVSAVGSKLTITAATQTYSGNYSCKGHHKTKSDVTTKASKPVQLTVYGKFHDAPSPIFVLNVYIACNMTSLKWYCFSFFSLISKQAQTHFDPKSKPWHDVPRRVCHLHMQGRCVLWMGISLVP